MVHHPNNLLVPTYLPLYRLYYQTPYYDISHSLRYYGIVIYLQSRASGTIAFIRGNRIQLVVRYIDLLLLLLPVFIAATETFFVRSTLSFKNRPPLFFEGTETYIITSCSTATYCVRWFALKSRPSCRGVDAIGIRLFNLPPATGSTQCDAIFVFQEVDRVWNCFKITSRLANQIYYSDRGKASSSTLLNCTVIFRKKNNKNMYTYLWNVSVPLITSDFSSVLMHIHFCDVIGAHLFDVSTIQPFKCAQIQRGTIATIYIYILVYKES
ncbi:hypothetical protein QTP88_008883 [Uroleucon formosanum]